MLHQTFQTFVDNRQDLAGLIAYALYKADKLDFMKTHPDRDVHGFVLGMNLPSQVEAYRTEAMSMLVIANLIAAAVSILLVVLVFGSKLNFWVHLLKYLAE
ncbi:hypothetical protein ACQ859_11995 [Roseateles chitinivorans]|uniref:hypothetical protein n=1 Tax=Roseateles chitinivorans TaxID=2917965 RepID=UPI003D677D4B